VKVTPEHFATMQSLCEAWLTEHAPDWKLSDILTGERAWTIYHKAGCFDALGGYRSEYNDAHIQTALEKVFPNAQFRDAKRY